MFTRKSKWIACGEEASAPIVWKTFSIDAVPQKSEISICGLGYYELFINGCRVGEDYFKPAVSDYGKRDFLISTIRFPVRKPPTPFTTTYMTSPPF
jgi:alpha-L-rhamnosidase